MVICEQRCHLVIAHEVLFLCSERQHYNLRIYMYKLLDTCDYLLRNVV